MYWIEVIASEPRIHRAMNLSIVASGRIDHIKYIYANEKHLHG